MKGPSVDGVFDLVDDALTVVGHLAGRLLRQPGALAQASGDLGDLFWLRRRGEQRRLGRQVEWGRALWRRLVRDHKVLAGLRMRTVEDGRYLLEVILREAVELQMLTALEVRLTFGDLVGGDPRGGEQLRQVGACEVLDGARVSD